MFKPRRIHRREEQKDRLYDALRKLYADGVRVCTGRPAAAARPAPPVRTIQSPPATRRVRDDEPLSLETDGASSAFDPYNHRAR